MSPRAKITSSLEGSELDVVVGQPQKAGDSVVSRHVAYLVTTKSSGWVVKRRFSDFSWLRAELVGRFAGLFIPSLPPKEMQGAAFKSSSDVNPNSSFINARLQLLRYFIDELVRIPFVRGDPSLTAFLSCQDDKDFEAAKEQTAKLTVMTDQSEGLAAWRDGLAASSPQHWDRIVNDFKGQIEQVEKNAKLLRASVDSYIDCLGATAMSSGKVAATLAASARNEAEFCDKSKFEFTNKDGELGSLTAQGHAAAFEGLHHGDLAQPDNFEYILRAGARFACNQVAAFRDFLKIREAQNAEVMKTTAQLDKHLEDQRNGKSVKAGGFFGSMGMSSGKSADEVIAACQADLDTKTQILNFMTSALEFSEIDRFNADRSRFNRQLLATVGASQVVLALEQQRVWGAAVASSGLGMPEVGLPSSSSSF